MELPSQQRLVRRSSFLIPYLEFVHDRNYIGDGRSKLFNPHAVGLRIDRSLQRHYSIFHFVLNVVGHFVLNENSLQILI